MLKKSICEAVRCIGAEEGAKNGVGKRGRMCRGENGNRYDVKIGIGYTGTVHSALLQVPQCLMQKKKKDVDVLVVCRCIAITATLAIRCVISCLVCPLQPNLSC